MNTTSYTKIGTGGAKIGRTGAKLHRASLMRTTFEDGAFKDSWVVVCRCGCQGLKSARGKIEFFADTPATCQG